MMPMTLKSLRRASRNALCLVALTFAALAVRADEPAGVSWSALSPPQQQVLHSFEERWSQLPPERQSALAKGSGRWLEMSPEQRSQAQERFQRWHELPPAQREIRAVAAAYMLGRAWEQLGDMERARAAFQATRRSASPSLPSESIDSRIALRRSSSSRK